MRTTFTDGANGFGLDFVFCLSPRPLSMCWMRSRGAAAAAACCLFCIFATATAGAVGTSCMASAPVGQLALVSGWVAGWLNGGTQHRFPGVHN